MCHRARDLARHRQAVQPTDASAPRSPAVPASGRVPASRASGNRADFFEARRDDEQRHDEPDAAQADAACVVVICPALGRPALDHVHPLILAPDALGTCFNCSLARGPVSRDQAPARCHRRRSDLRRRRRHGRLLARRQPVKCSFSRKAIPRVQQSCVP